MTTEGDPTMPTTPTTPAEREARRAERTRERGEQFARAFMRDPAGAENRLMGLLIVVAFVAYLAGAATVGLVAAAATVVR